MNPNQPGRAASLVLLALAAALALDQPALTLARAGPANPWTSGSVAGQAPAQEVTFPSSRLTLHGFIYRPDGTGPFPALLWNHGSEQRPGWLPELGPLFTRAGYVFFVPHRRGQGRSPGPYILDDLEREHRERGAEARSRLLVTLLEQQVEDQEAGLVYLRGLPYVDANRTAVAGCSFGGIQTVLAAERQLGLRAAIDFAGAAQTWSNSPDIRERLIRAARQITIPMLFIQAENDYDLTPSYTLARELEGAGRAAQVRVYPRFGQSAQDGHDFCVRGADIWSPAVLAFLDETMR